MAGTKAAADLYAAGVKNTLILEARDRVGGRLVSHKTTKDKSSAYDFGASWFHDGIKNPLFEKAQKLGNVEYFFDDGKNMVISQNETDIPAWKFERVMNEISDFCSLYYEDSSLPDMSLKQMCELYMEKHGHKLRPEEAKYAPQALRMWSEMWDGLHWNETSAKEYAGAGLHLGRNAYVKSGFVNVYQNELKELPQSYRDSNIKLNMHVSAIDYLDPKEVKVTTASHEIYTAEYVIVTIPLSLYAVSDPKDKCYMKWTPGLPDLIQRFLPSCKFGSLGKVVFEFDSAFWPEDVHRFYALSSGMRNKDPIEPWAHPTLVVNYSAMGGPPSLVFLTQDPVSSAIEGMDKTQIFELFEPVLRKIATKPVTKPINVLNTGWNNDPYTRGAYIGTRVGCMDFEDLCHAFTAGISPRVRVAGADSIDGSSNGCAHGAWYSGEREAAYIIRAMKHKSRL